ncbi:MAG: hypothetical protein QOG75_667 [Mycobacterium sp.]|jgi:hypothetical protein|nr:hypothetical protein [Mycobacterium sp.]
MKRSTLMALTVAAGIVAAGCSPISSEPPTTATPRAPTTATASAAGPAPTSMAELCDAQTWPRAVPDVVGQHLSQTTNIGALACWDNIRGVAPDGHDPINNPARPGDVGYRITALSPSPGAPVGRHDLVTVQLADADTNAPPAFRPCDWVTTDEAAGILGGPITTRSWGDDAGSVDMSCSYSLGPGGDGIHAGLRLPGAFPVDAASQLALAAAQPHATSVNGIGIKAVCVFEPNITPPSTTLSVLLSGDRIYRATGWYSMPCDKLKPVAQAAIDRIGG